MTRIPNREDPGLYTDIVPAASSFVELRSGEIDVSMQYPRLGIKNAVAACYVRQEVYERLIAAQRLLPEGIRLRVWDAWRPFSLQMELYETYARFVIDQFGLADRPEEERRRIIQKYVSFPENNRDVPPVHTTGGAVDVTLIDARGSELPMGTGFDEFSEKAHTAYYETAPESEDDIRLNRRMLYRCMTLAGFSNLPSEWWHFDYGDRFWAYYSHTPARYRGAFTLEEVKEP